MQAESTQAPQAPDDQPSKIGQPQVQLQLPTTRPTLTYILLGLNVVIFVATYLLDQTLDPRAVNPILEFGILDYSRILLNGEFYRLFTAMFLHLSPAHIFFNAYALWRFGQTVEGLFGHVRFALIYFLGGFTGSLLSFIIGKGASAGASGAIFAIIAAEMVFLYRHRELLGERAAAAFRELLILGGLNLGLGVLTAVAPTNGGRIDNWGHIGGFIGGLLLSLMIAPQFTIQRDECGPALSDEKPLSVRWPLAVFSALVLLGITLAALLTLPRP